jgi:hypothetical protein
MVDGYCVKCKEKGIKMKDAVVSKTARGGFIAKGKCSKCNTSMCAMMSEEKAQKAVSSNEAKKGW